MINAGTIVGGASFAAGLGAAGFTVDSGSTGALTDFLTFGSAEVDGALAVVSGGTVASGKLTVGGKASDHGSLAIMGGASWAATDIIQIGGGGGQGALTINGGIVTTTRDLQVEQGGTVEGVGSIIAAHAINAGGTLLADPGLLSVTGDLLGNAGTVGTNDIATNGTLQLNGSVDATQDLYFLGQSGELNLSVPGQFNGTIDSFSGRDVIFLNGITVTGFTQTSRQIIFSDAGVTVATVNFAAGPARYVQINAAQHTVQILPTAPATFAWQTNGGGAWTSGSNWLNFNTGTTNAGSPQANDIAYFFSGGPGTVTGGAADSPAGSRTVQFAAGGPWTLAGAYSFGTVVANVPLTIAAGANVSVDNVLSDTSAASITVDGFLGGSTAQLGLVGQVALNGGTLDGNGTVSGAVVNDSGTLRADGGSLVLTGALSGSPGGTADIVNNATLTLAGAVASSQTIAFESGNGALNLTAPMSFAGTIGSFTGNDVINLTNIQVATVDQSIPGTMSFYDAAHVLQARLVFIDGMTHVPIIHPDGSVTVDVSCFVTGTRILTERGEVAVEKLRVGDRVVTVDGPSRRLRPIKWIGEQWIDVYRHARPVDVRPIRIARHAFGPDMPHRPLMLSPDHSLFVGGVLIPIQYLVTGTTIAPVDVPSVRYFHIELDRHAVLLAENLPAESYLDVGDRDNFMNGGLVRRLHADVLARMHEAGACAPITVTGPMLDAARALLRRRESRTQWVPAERLRGWL